jgi:hypothetical protein
LDFFKRIICDLELGTLEQQLLYNRVQNARSTAYPGFRWKSEVLRQLRKFDQIPASRLYKWARQGEEFGEEVADLNKIVSDILYLSTF